ncbi:MAG: hypothetical protein AB7V42_03850 [Thermoleophilia bacterium]
MPVQSTEEIVAGLAEARGPEPPSGPYLRAPAARYEAMTAGVLRQSHAHEAAERPDAAATYEQALGPMHLWVRRVPGAAPSVALALSVHRSERGVYVDAGYRVYGDSDGHAAELAADPALALATLLTRFGLEHRTPAGPRLLVPLRVANLPAPLEELSLGRFGRAVGMDGMPEDGRVAVNMRAQRSGDGSSRLAWLFAIDLGRYEADARSHRR